MRPARDQGIYVPQHRHDEGMLALVHEGLVLVQAGNEVWTVMPGSLAGFRRA